MPNLKMTFSTYRLGAKNVWLTFLFALCFCEVLSERRGMWTTLQKAIGQFDKSFFTVSSSDVSAKAKAHLGKDTLSFVVSPLWLELLLLTISLGASGQTLRELNEGMFLNVSVKEKEEMLRYYMKVMTHEDENIKLEIINMMFIRKDLEVTEHFRKFATETFNMTIDSVDFSSIPESKKLLNKKVANRTKRKMKEIFDDDDFNPKGTSVVLVSSVYYKNRWLYPPTVLNGTWDFIQKDDKANHTRVKMYRVNGIMPYANIRELDAEVVDIPYITPGISMLVFLPNKGVGLLDMEKKVMHHKDILKYTRDVMTPTPVAVSLPRYSLEMAVLLPRKCEMMGIKKIFSQNADLDGMVEGSNVTITNAVQRIKLWADAGRGAYKDTGDEELPIPQTKIFADHPFLFIIKMNSTSFMMGHFTV